MCSMETLTRRMGPTGRKRESGKRQRGSTRGEITLGPKIKGNQTEEKVGERSKRHRKKKKRGRGKKGTKETPNEYRIKGLKPKKKQQNTGPQAGEGCQNPFQTELRKIVSRSHIGIKLVHRLGKPKHSLEEELKKRWEKSTSPCSEREGAIYSKARLQKVTLTK